LEIIALLIYSPDLVQSLRLSERAFQFPFLPSIFKATVLFLREQSLPVKQNLTGRVLGGVGINALDRILILTNLQNQINSQNQSLLTSECGAMNRLNYLSLKRMVVTISAQDKLYG
jgi:hypothetical protein